MKKVTWLLVSCLMVVSLLIASCNNTATPTTSTTATTPTATTNPTPTPTTGQGQITSPDQPKYGGKITIISNVDVTHWGAAAVPQNTWGSGYNLEQILGIDRSRGPAGTGEADFSEGAPSMTYVTGFLAESWETPAVGVWKLTIRQGVHFASNMDTDVGRLVNNREMTADDVVASIEYLRDTPSSWVNSSEPTLIKNTTVEKTGDWEITVNTPVAATTGYLWIMGGGGGQYVWPKEMLEKYGTSNKWQDQIGTGPFILKDYLAASSITYERNDNYWGTDPVGPGKGNQLPYADGVDYLIIPDLSTRLAALRTGKADWTNDLVTIEDTDTLLRSNPDMQVKQQIIEAIHVGMNINLTDSPFSKVQVRQAMMLAIDHPTIVKDLYKGQAELLDAPARIYFPTVYVPMDQQPDIVKEMYGYDPDKAKQLLAEAGYPDGFKIQMDIRSSNDHTQAAELLKNYWGAVGIDVAINVLEPTAWTGVWASHKEDHLLMTHGIYSGGDAALFVRYSMGYYRGPNVFNISHVDDPPGTDAVIEDAYNKQAANVMINFPAADQAFKEVVPYILEQAFLIALPAPHGFRVWQPWMKNYYGETSQKFWLQYAWIDQDLKQSMTGSR